ncbi:uncharacterized protein [Primulina eburnea]|uniref:uncharacterized protein n=1 Tax=Primulina eburnea TaxID=1245227 RepID=UPI003C6BF4CD
MWENCKWPKTNKGKLAYSIVMSMSFWNGVTLCLKLFASLVRVFRLIDGDRKPSMGFLYGELLRAKEDIKVALNNVESNYQPIIVILESKMKDTLYATLHTTAFLLNPYYYKDSSTDLYGEVAAGIFECIEVLYADEFELQDTIINKKFAKYRDKTGLFGKALAAKSCEKNDYTFDPCTWWSSYGAHTPNLLRVALRILLLTTSSSGCERNWSAFEGIHTKKRNRLDVHRLNNLVFVQFNARLFNNQKKKKERNVDVLLEKDASNVQSWIVDGGEKNEVESGSS